MDRSGTTRESGPEVPEQISLSGLMIHLKFGQAYPVAAVKYALTNDFFF